MIRGLQHVVQPSTCRAPHGRVCGSPSCCLVRPRCSRSSPCRWPARCPPRRKSRPGPPTRRRCGSRICGRSIAWRSSRTVAATATEIIPSPREDASRTLTQHTEIELEHGINTRCFNCHHPREPRRLRRRLRAARSPGISRNWSVPSATGRSIATGSTVRTAGPTATGTRRRGPQTRRKCIECHDPHQPPFPPMKPAPAPNTLRMGPQDARRTCGRPQSVAAQRTRAARSGTGRVPPGGALSHGRPGQRSMTPDGSPASASAPGRQPPRLSCRRGSRRWPARPPWRPPCRRCGT